MAVTLNSTGVTFSNGQTLATNNPTVSGSLGAVQYGGQIAIYYYGQQGYTTSEQYTTAMFAYFGSVGGYMGNAQTTVFCGFGTYRYGTTAQDDASTDGGLLYVRCMYRTVV
jgi:hypothetical protein